MSAHDPLCDKPGTPADRCRVCTYIRKGRADALVKARAAVAAAQAEVGDVNFCTDCADWAVAAIDALRGES